MERKFRIKRDELCSFFIDKLLSSKCYGNWRRFNQYGEGFLQLELTKEDLRFTGCTPFATFIEKMLIDNEKTVKAEKDRGETTNLTYKIRTSSKSFRNSNNCKQNLYDALNIDFKSTNRHIMKILKDENGDVQGFKQNCEIWSMPVSNIDRHLREFISWDRCRREWLDDPTTKLEALTFPNGQRQWYSSHYAKDPESALKRQYSPITQCSKNFRHGLLVHCGDFYEIDINSCASQRIANEISSVFTRTSVRSKIAKNKFYRYDDGMRETHKQEINKMIFSQISKKKGYIHLRYNGTDSKKQLLIDHVMTHTTLTKRESTSFVSALISLIDLYGSNKSRLHAELLSLESFMVVFQEKNQTVIDNTPVSLDILRVHDCLYVRGIEKAKELMEFLKMYNVLFKVEKIDFIPAAKESAYKNSIEGNPNTPHELKEPFSVEYISEVKANQFIENRKTYFKNEKKI